MLCLRFPTQQSVSFRGMLPEFIWYASMLSLLEEVPTEYVFQRESIVHSHGSDLSLIFLSYLQ